MSSKSISNLLLSLILLFGISEYSKAGGTPAGTVISSRTKVVYSTASGVQSDTIYSNSVSFTVAQISAVNISPANNSFTTSTDSVNVAYAATVTNSGNGSDQFSLSAASTKGWTRNFYFDANGDGVLQNSEITAGVITQTASISADAAYKIIIRVTVPRDPALNNQTDTTVITAQAVFDNKKSTTANVKTTVQTVNFGNVGTGLSVTPTNPSTGQNVVYTFTITNSGNVSATGVTFSNLFPPSQFSFIGATNGGTNSGGNVIWNIGTVAPGTTTTITVTLQVLPGLSNGTILTNTIGVNYTVGGNTFTVSSNSPYAAVGITRGVSITPTSSTAIKEAEDTLAYAFTIKNNGNTKDVLELSFSSSQSFTWIFYRDVNQNGILDAGDTPLTDRTGSSPGVDADSVAAIDSVKIFSRLIIPKVSTDQTQDVTTFTVKSGADASKFASGIGTTTINIPVISLVRSVSPSGNQPPGQEMIFTITYQNTGRGKAYNFLVTETEPDSMSYVTNSVTINDITKTDAADGDNVTITTVNGRKVINNNLGTINGLSAVGTIRFRGTIH